MKVIKFFAVFFLMNLCYSTVPFMSAEHLEKINAEQNKAIMAVNQTPLQDPLAQITKEVNQALEQLKRTFQVAGGQQGMTEATAELTEEVQQILGELRGAVVEAQSEMGIPSQKTMQYQQAAIAAETLKNLSRQVNETLQELKQTLVEVKATLADVRKERVIQNATSAIIKAYYQLPNVTNPYIASQYYEAMKDIVEHQYEMVEEAYEMAAAKAYYDALSRSTTMFSRKRNMTEEQVEAQVELREERQEAMAEAKESSTAMVINALQQQQQGTPSGLRYMNYDLIHEVVKEMYETRQEIASEMYEQQIEAAAAAAVAKQYGKSMPPAIYSSSFDNHIIPMETVNILAVLAVIGVAVYLIYKNKKNKYKKRQLFFENVRRDEYAQINV